MEELLFKSLPQLGVAGVSIGAMVYLVKYMLDYSAKILKEMSERHMLERQSSETAFREFVTERNHQTGQLIAEATVSMKESTAAIKESSEFIREATKVLIEGNRK